MSDTEHETEKQRKSKKEKSLEPVEDRIKNLKKAIARDELNLEKTQTAIMREQLKIASLKLAGKLRASKNAE